ncbi:MAG: hypothetical protein M1827_001611 [Pycnora praestabilis]|nr:MAG: hypothetical protein M1827_001611 [Pycnora praestabilis]
MAPPIEITVPSAQTSTTPKPYTLYNITLRLPLRSYTIQKRYSDFTTLHSTLTFSTGIPPPATLPPKSWLSRTTSSPVLTESRRKALETYLQTLNDPETPDTWRNSPAWRAFLNLPSSTASAAASSAVQGLHSALTSSSPITDPSVWLDVHRELKSQLHDARLHLSQRDQVGTAQAQHESSASAKRCLVKAGTLITALERGLKQGGPGEDWGEKLGEGEMRRRKDLLGGSKREKEGLEVLGNSMSTKGREGSSIGGTGRGVGTAQTTAQDESKSVLFGATNGTHLNGHNNTRSGGRVLGAPLPETSRTRELDNEGVLQLQKQMMQEQDLDVEALAKVVARQREIGFAINGELEEQNALLRLMDEDVERVQGKVGVAKKRIGKIS